MNMPDALIKQTIQELEDEEFRLEYGEEIAKMDFALALIATRKEYHITQKQLADILGVSQAYIARLESGEANPTVGKVGRIFAATRKRLSWTTIPLGPASDSIPTRQTPLQAQRRPKLPRKVFGELVYLWGSTVIGPNHLSGCGRLNK
jgi:transcriptional regulator with XRE-family HTH domain